MSLHVTSPYSMKQTKAIKAKPRQKLVMSKILSLSPERVGFSVVSHH